MEWQRCSHLTSKALIRNLYDLALHLVQTQISCLATASTFIYVYDRNGIHHSIKSAERQTRCQSVEATKMFLVI